MRTPDYLIVVESFSWILTVLAFGSLYLNKPGKVLTYLSEAAYPVYIVHMIFLYLGSHLVFQWAIPVQLQFVLVLAFTLAGCFASFEVIRRLKWVRPLFGLRVQQGKRTEQQA
jgi:membrane-bound acyltransferase YfiQ involved in biofilm formation